MSDTAEIIEEQKTLLLGHFNTGKTVTALEAGRQYGVGRLAARVHDLKKLGHKISKRMIAVQKANGRIARVAEYWIKLEDM